MSALSGDLIRMRRWPFIVISAVLLLWSRFGAPALVATSYQSATQYEGIYRAAAAPGAVGEPIAEQVVIFVVDGLRVDVSRQLSELNQLRARGAVRVLQVGQPSLSFPGWTAIATGAWPEQSGVSSNDIERPIELDTIFHAARKGGLDAAIVGSAGWRTLFNPEGVELHLLSEPPEYDSLEDILAFDERLVQTARKVLLREPQLTLVHLLGVDTAGHGFGGASVEYAQAAASADRLIAGLIASIDLSRAAVFVTADHGHIDSGGHGGHEAVVRRVPLLATGKGVKPGVYADAGQVDIAPTVAVLLGLEIPAHNQGDALFDQIDAPAALRARRALDVAAQLADRHRALLLAIDPEAEMEQGLLERAQSAMAGADYAEAENLARESGEQARAQWQAQREARLMRERLSRAPIVALLLLPFGLYSLWWWRAGWGWRTPMLGALLFFVVWHALFRARGFTFSVSWFNIDPILFVHPRVVEAVLALIAVTVFVGALNHRARKVDVALATTHALFFIAAGMAVQIAAFYLAWDVVYDWYLPDLAAGGKYYLDVSLSTSFWPLPALPLAALLPLLSMMVAWLAAPVARSIRRNWCALP